MNDALLLTFTTIALSIVLAWPLGIYMRRIYSDEHCLAKRLLGPVERAIYAVAGIDAKADMGWKQYALLWILFNVVGGVFLYVLLYFQVFLGCFLVGSSRVDLQACKLEYSIVSPK